MKLDILNVKLKYWHKIFVCILLLLLNSFKISADNECPKCQKLFPDNFNFCPNDRTPLKKVVIIQPKKMDDTNLNKNNEQTETSLNNPNFNFNNDTNIIAIAIETKQKSDLKEQVIKGAYDYDKTMTAIKKFFDTDKPLAFFLLNYLYERYPKDYELLKLFAAYYISIEEYDEAQKKLEESEKILNAKIKELEKKNNNKNQK